MTFVDLRDIRVDYDGKRDILKDLNISMEKEELVSLLGPNGCGKTTTLRAIAGLIKPNDGRFFVDREKLTRAPVHKRSFGMVFQSYASLPHLTIAENVAFGLRLRRENKQTIDRKIAGMLKVHGLENLGNRYPKRLSGGQRQRVVLAHTLIIEPKLLLLDGPLSNLDAKLQVVMRIKIKRIQQQLGITTVFVTHDQEECFSISDKVAIMNDGAIEQCDSLETIYHLPRTKFVAEFVGFGNFFSVEEMETDHCRTQTNQIVKTTNPEPNVTTTVATVRPGDIEIVSEAATNIVAGTVAIRIFLGESYQYEVETVSGTLLVNGTSEQLYGTNETTHLAFLAEKLAILER